MPSGDPTSPRCHVSFLEPKDLPRWYDTVGDDVRTRVATTTIDGIVLYAIFDEQSEYPEAAMLEDGGESWSAARADCTRSQAPSSRQEQGTPRGSDDALGDLAVAIPCPVHYLIVQFTPDAQAIDPGKTFCDSVALFNPRKLIVGLDMAQWSTIERCLESLPYCTAHVHLGRLCDVNVMFLDDKGDSSKDWMTQRQRTMMFQESGIPSFWARQRLKSLNTHFSFVRMMAVTEAKITVLAP